MKKLDLTRVEAIINTLEDVVIYLENCAEIHSVKTWKDGTTHTVYNLENKYITVRKDVYTSVYGIEIRLKKRAVIAENTIENGVIASSRTDGKVWL
ncbi:MAG: hypothetical protein NC177_09620 [Ruminococcus flavefaciens]|nr:hypothetical protein [Ruminococcus flavefaciens]